MMRMRSVVKHAELECCCTFHANFLADHDAKHSQSLQLPCCWFVAANQTLIAMIVSKLCKVQSELKRAWLHCMKLLLHALQEDAEPETINHASGDEVDTSLIIPGGRRARKGRPQIGGQTKYKYQQKLADSDEDSW